MKIVIDASVAVSWCYRDERTPNSQALLELVAENGAVVPSLWHLEVGNALLVGEIRNRIAPSGVNEQLDNFSQLPIEVDTATAAFAWDNILEIARTHRLTTYDAAYVELALRLSLPLASRDKDMVAAAKELGIEIIAA